MDLFHYSDYKRYIADRVALMPKKGRGEYQKMAQALGTHSTRLSHVLKGDVEFTLEQAASLCQYWGLNGQESEYFLLLVQISRAGTPHLRTLLKNSADGLRERSAQLAHRIRKDVSLNEDEKGTFYSSWLYSGVRLLSSIEGYQDIDAISRHFDLPRETIAGIVEFLLRAGLCEERDGKIAMRSKVTHLESSSALVKKHHLNWRIRALVKQDRLTSEELAYTAPISIAKKDQAKIRRLLSQTIEKFVQEARESEPPDTLACLTIDFFNF